jgi:hypothetical protein
MNQELHTTHLTKSTLDHIGQSSEADYNHYNGDVTEQTISQLQNRFNASTRSGRPLQEDALSEKSDTKSFGTGPAIWGNGARQPPAMNNNTPMGQQYPATMTAWGNDASRSFYSGNTNIDVGSQAFGPIQPQSRFSNGHSNYRGRNGFLNEPTHFPLDQSYRGGLTSNPPSRPGSAFDAPRYNQYPGYINPLAEATGRGMSPTLPPISMPPMGMYGPPNTMNTMTPYQPRPIGSLGTRLSPEAAEFSVEVMGPGPWNTQVNNNSSIMMIKLS